MLESISRDVESQAILSSRIGILNHGDKTSSH